MLALSALVSEIKRTHLDATKTAKIALKKIFRVGFLLVQAKSRVEHGEWEDWVRLNLPFGERQAQKYMQSYESRAEITAAAKANREFAFAGIDRALAMLRPPPQITGVPYSVQPKQLYVTVKGGEPTQPKQLDMILVKDVNHRVMQPAHVVAKEQDLPVTQRRLPRQVPTQAGDLIINIRNPVHAATTVYMALCNGMMHPDNWRHFVAELNRLDVERPSVEE
jgi:hypothetical protein